MRLVPLCIFRQTSKIQCIRGGQRTKSTVFSLLLSVLHHHMLLDGEIGSDVISEKSLPFERQTQSLLSPLALLSLIFFCVVCLLGQQMGTSHYHRSQFPLTDLTAIFRPFFIHTYTFSPFGKGNRKTRKSL